MGGALARVARMLGLGARSARARVGREGERHAERHLREKGYRVLARNALLPGPVRGGVRAEADLICEASDGRTIVIAEVKARTRGAGVSAMGNEVAPERQIDRRKERALRAIARRVVRANGWEGRPLRIDVVAVEIERGADGDERVTVRHHEGAVAL